MSNIARSGARATFARRIWRHRLECSERARGTEEGEVSLREAERGRGERGWVANIQKSVNPKLSELPQWFKSFLHPVLVQPETVFH